MDNLVNAFSDMERRKHSSASGMMDPDVIDALFNSELAEDEGTRMAINMMWRVFTAIGFFIALFNTVVHIIVAVLFMLKPDSMHHVWSGAVQGIRFERPGSALKYILSGAAFEGWSLLYYCFSGASDAAMHLYAFQLFTLGGINLYDKLILSRPRMLVTPVFHFMYLEVPVAVSLYLDESVDLGLLDVVQVWIGVKVLGFLWGFIVVAALRLARIAKFDYALSPRQAASASASQDGVEADTPRPDADAEDAPDAGADAFAQTGEDAKDKKRR